MAASRTALRRPDGEMRVRDIEILRAVPMLGALPAATIEQLGAGLEHAEFAPGQVVIEQGDRGDRSYVVESGCGIPPAATDDTGEPLVGTAEGSAG